MNANNTREVLINNLGGNWKNNMPILGRPFLTSAYFIVDQDHRQFTLAQVNRTSDKSLVPLGPPTCDHVNSTITSASGASGGDTHAATSSNSKMNPAVPSSHQGLSKGAIVGTVIGSVSAVALCLGALLLFMRRRHTRQQHLEREEAVNRENTRTSIDSQSAVRMNRQEMSTDHEHQPRVEMPLERHSPYQLAPHEMPSRQQLHINLRHNDRRLYEMPMGRNPTNRLASHELAAS